MHGKWEVPREVDNLIPVLYLDHIRNVQKEVSRKEDKHAIFQMSGSKALEPDGIPAVFYNKFWPRIGEYVFELVKYFFDKGFLLKE